MSKNKESNSTIRSSISENTIVVNSESTSNKEIIDGKGDKSIPYSQECTICLEKISKMGSVDSCIHTFCFECIVKWSKVTNKCPICSKKFHSVTEVVEKEDDSSGHHLVSVIFKMIS